MFYFVGMGLFWKVVLMILLFNFSVRRILVDVDLMFMICFGVVVKVLVVL